MNKIIHDVVIGGDTAFDRGLEHMVDGIRSEVNPLAKMLSDNLPLTTALILTVGVPWWIRTVFFRLDGFAQFCMLLLSLVGVTIILFVLLFAALRTVERGSLFPENQEADHV